ncbi:MAG: phosphoenolpyruvate carboxykinase (GTP) [Planctomycetes bacterium]|nr:phosphoenolpyruvate carboxykinase (GTP) [Planctomycetota bacterium]
MGPAPKHGIDWHGKDWTPEAGKPGAHPNARFTAPAEQCPVICPDWQNPAGVPIDIFVFGGRRASVVPLVTQAFDWDHGVYMGATASSETTAANIGAVGNLRRDPFAMTPFCGYHMGDYIQHYFNMGDKLGSKAPKAFYVNWFRKDNSGKWLWPGFGENARVLKWMCERIDGKVGARETAIGYVPAPEDLDLAGLNTSAEDLAELLKVDAASFKAEVAGIKEYFAKLGSKLPPRLAAQLEKLEKRLG